MPYQSPELKRHQRRLEKEREEEERQRLEEERRRKEEEERLERVRVYLEEYREVLKQTAPPAILAIRSMADLPKINDEGVLESRFRYTFSRRNAVFSKDHIICPAKQGDKDMTVQIFTLSQMNRFVKDHFKIETVKVIKYLGSEQVVNQNPNMERVFEVYLSSDKVYIFLDEIASSRKNLSTINPMGEAEAKPIARQVGDAVNFLHLKGIAHLSVKPENILIDQDSSQVKLTDSKLYFIYWDVINKMPIEIRTALIKGDYDSKTFPYLPPEVFTNETWDGSKVDIWSWEVIICYRLSPESGEK